MLAITITVVYVTTKSVKTAIYHESAKLFFCFV